MGGSLRHSKPGGHDGCGYADKIIYIEEEHVELKKLKTRKIMKFEDTSAKALRAELPKFAEKIP